MRDHVPTMNLRSASLPDIDDGLCRLSTFVQKGSLPQEAQMRKLALLLA